MTAGYLTIERPAVVETVVERSRFIAHCREVGTETDAKAFIGAIRAEHAQASHNCYAYRIGAGDHPLTYYNDHGEPSGTAGKPILGAIERLRLMNVVIVVTRYFGGKKLGVRGLIEAYGQAATSVLQAAGQTLRVPTYSVSLTYPYPNHETLLHRLQQIGAIVQSTEFTDTVTTRFIIPEERREVFQVVLRELPFRVECNEK